MDAEEEGSVGANAGTGTGAGGGSGVTYFCHQCSQEMDHVTEEYTCPHCHSGFIEQLREPLGHGEEDDDEDFDGEAPYNPGDQILEQILGPLLFGGGLSIPLGGRVNVSTGRSGAAGGGGIRLGVGGGPAAATTGGAVGGAAGGGQHLLMQEILANLTGVMGAGAEGAGGGMQSIFVPGGAGMQMYGNPGDYAWGRGGLDTIVTQLLNQLDGAGPAPLKTEYIKEIPIVKIAKEHIDSKLQCSVCWEDFTLGEAVRQLHCDHMFHDPCIVPWLELHSTCPVCRKSQDPEGSPHGDAEEGEGDEVSEPSSGTGRETNASPLGNAMSYVFNLLGTPSSRTSPSASSPATATATSSQTSSSAAATRPSSSGSSQRQNQDVGNIRNDGDDFEDFDLE